MSFESRIPNESWLDIECYGGFGRGMDVSTGSELREDECRMDEQKPVPPIFGKGAGAAALLGVKPKRRKP